MDLPKFKIMASDLPTVSGGIGNLNPRKFIIRFNFTDFSTASTTMKLLIYPAVDHRHHGQGINPIIISPSPGATTNVQNELTLGNIEIKTSELVKPPPNHNTYRFHYLELTPKLSIVNPDINPHLVFSIKAYDSAGVEILAVTELMEDANPSPPKPPCD